jgi:2-oxoglutarate dehydrogenase E2 component (dihydrolipoamide succinyltransferase)
MRVEIKIPAMGESVTEAVIGQILQPSGSMVAIDQEILEIETDKVNQTLYAPQAGQLTLQVKTGDAVSIGKVIGYVETQATAAAPSAPSPKKEDPKKEERTAPPQPKASAAPSARSTTSEFIAEIKAPPSQAASPAPEPAPMPRKTGGGRKKMSNLRRLIAKKLVEVKNTTAMLTTFNEIDMSAVMAIRSKEKESFETRYGVRLGFMSFFVKAVSAALKAYPEVNAFIEGDEIVTFTAHDIGVSVGKEKGLFVPVIRYAASLSF